MKFTVSVASIMFLLPILAQASPAGRFGAGGFGNQFGNPAQFGKGGAPAAANNKGGAGAGAAGNKGAAAASAAAASSAAAATAAAATATAAAASNATAGAGAAAANSGDAQTSLTLDPAVIAQGFAQDGQAQQEAGQVPSLTSTNNFINFCATTNLPITNGQQIVTGSCNPAPMGVIAAQANMPSSKFQVPANGQVIPENTAFTITMAISNLETGNFVNPNTNYFAAPQQVNSAGAIVGHSHVVIEALSSMTQTAPTDPTKFAFFKGLNGAAQNGVLTADVTAGLPAGTYRLASINTAANHQPALVAVAQHGALDDMVYFTVQGAGAAAASNPLASGAAATAAAAATGASAAATNAAGAAAASASAAAASPALSVKGGAPAAKGGNAGANAKAAAAAAPAAAAAAPAGALKGGKPAAAGGKRSIEFARDVSGFQSRAYKRRAVF
ncbi:hypothetical protein BDW22DRAFT_1344315 [Trametopsis cervina]|nr:hypothetical protein BDW22DRAFT_1344315 [Trametopsis cervina]